MQGATSCYPHREEQDGLLDYIIPKERERDQAWFDGRFSHRGGHRPIPNDSQVAFPWEGARS